MADPHVVKVTVVVVSSHPEELVGTETISTVKDVIDRACAAVRKNLYEKLRPGTGNTLIVGVTEGEENL